jgi:NADH dehydrogenase
LAKVRGAARHAVPLRSLDDATLLRNKLLRSLEAAAAPDEARPGDTRVAVVGGGPTGVELSGYLADFLSHHQFTPDYPQLDAASIRVTLIEHGDRLLPEFDPSLSARVLDVLRSRGVDVRLDTDVLEVDSDGVTISDGRRIRAATVVWAGGVAAPSWVERLGPSLRHGRVVVDPDLRLPGHPDTFVVGDLAALPARGAGLHPQLAQVAIETGRHAGHQIGLLAGGKPTAPLPHFGGELTAVTERDAPVGLWWHVPGEDSDTAVVEPGPARPITAIVNAGARERRCS